MPTISHQFFVHASSQKVFDIFCLPEGLNSWWTLESSGQPILGSSYRFYFGPEYDWRAEVIAVSPGKSLTWKMKAAMEDWLPTEISFNLSPEENGTRINFFHSHWKTENDHFAITNFCWGQLLNGLKNYAEKGIVIPFEKRN